MDVEIPQPQDFWDRQGDRLGTFAPCAHSWYFITKIKTKLLKILMRPPSCSNYSVAAKFQGWGAEGWGENSSPDVLDRAKSSWAQG